MRLAIATITLAACTAVHAAEPPPAPPEGRFCDEHPAKCVEMRQQRAAFCDEHPKTCMSADKRTEERGRYCKQHPGECDPLKNTRAERQREMRERSDTFCRRNPDQCEPRPDDDPNPPRRSGPPR